MSKLALNNDYGAQTKVITLRNLGQIPKTRHSLPKSWIQAAGILKGAKKGELARHLKKIRREWDRRIK